VSALGLETVILCGGMGTRLREETEFKPKPMVEIGGRPIIWHIMRHYRHYGSNRFILCLGYKGDIIRNYFLNYHLYTKDLQVDLATGNVESLMPTDDRVDWKVNLVETGQESLTGRRIYRAMKYIQGDSFLVTYGDGVSDIDLDAVVSQHRRLGRLATVTAVHPSSRFGELGLDEDVVRSFQEKPQVKDGWINGGYMVFQRRAFDLMEPDENVTLEGGILERLASIGELAVYRHHGFWQCMDTFREMQLLNDLWDSGRAPWAFSQAASVTVPG